MLPDSTNPRVMADNIRRIQTEVENAVELPSVQTTDEGKVLTVNSSGKWAALDPASQLPAVTAADEGSLLTVNSSGEWSKGSPIIGNLDYSETEQNTGVKWIDGKDIYCKVLTLPEDSETQSPIEKTINLGNIDTLIYYIGNIKSVRTALGDYIEFDLTDYYTGDHNSRTDYSSGPSQFNLRLICPTTYHFGGATIIAYYTKPDPVPAETTTTRKRKTTKGEN